MSYSFNISDSSKVVFTENIYGVCTKCKAITPIAKLGLRTIGKEIRNQAQCQKCRVKKEK